MSALTILKVDDPQIGIKFHLTLQPIFKAECVGPFHLMHPAKTARRVIGLHLALRRGTIECARAIKAIKPNKNCASLCRAPLAQNRKGTLDFGATQKGRNPNIGTQPHSIERNAAGSGQFFQNARRHFPRHRQFAIAFETLKRQLGTGTENAIGFHRAIAEPIESTLD